MHSSLTAVLFCIFAQAAGAQCVDSVTAAQDRVQSAARVEKVAAPAAAGPNTRGELIKTAAAATHDDVTAMPRRAAPVAAPKEDEERRHGGPAMLLAALALMSAIALRRFGAGK